MKQFCNVEESKIYPLIVRISLVSLICLLSLFDAPEYTRCTHVGVCEFLEVCGDTTDTRKLENLLESMNKPLPRFISVKGRFGQLAGFFSWLKKIIYENFIRNSVSPIILPFLCRCVSPAYNLFSSPLKPEGKAPAGKEQNLPSKESDSPSLALQIITISFIKS
ncbi:MAG: hypothetical protein QG610_1969 [Euryarchaeota archaeon]|nr:hypothetical protein [Euryarchaeota archaeon]